MSIPRDNISTQVFGTVKNIELIIWNIKTDMLYGASLAGKISRGCLKKDLNRNKWSPARSKIQNLD